LLLTYALSFFQSKVQQWGSKQQISRKHRKNGGCNTTSPLLGRIFLIPELLTIKRPGYDGGGSSSHQQVRRNGLIRITRIVIREPRYCTKEGKLGACKSNTYKEEKENGIQ